jgi:glycosyltransferase involved in cell wall biosynthesis
MNLPFCFWLWKRALLKQDRVEVMIHEPFLTFSGRSWKQSGAAAVHRLMMIVLLNAASHVWMSIPGWKKLLKPYALGRKIPFDWLPVSNNIPVIDDPCGVQELRVRHAPAGELIIGHFGTYGQHITDLLIKSLPAIMRHSSECVLVLLGRGGTGVRQELARRYPDLSHRMHAPGELSASDLSRHISACDLLFQPYPDGISSRRTSAMVGLAHGLPLVTTSGHLTESLWLDSDAVAIAPVEEISGLIAAAEKLLRDKKKREDLGSSAKKLYQERFDVSHTVALLRGSSTPVADGSSTNLLLQH